MLVRQTPSATAKAWFVDVSSFRVPLAGSAVTFEPSWTAVPEQVANLVRAGDLVLTVGAGDVTMLGPELLRAIEDRRNRVPAP